jgi:hypothetical protein
MRVAAPARLRMMLSVELGVRFLPRGGTPGGRTRGAVEQVEKISSKRDSFATASFRDR